MQIQIKIYIAPNSLIKRDRGAGIGVECIGPIMLIVTQIVLDNFRNTVDSKVQRNLRACGRKCPFSFTPRPKRTAQHWQADIMAHHVGLSLFACASPP